MHVLIAAIALACARPTPAAPAVAGPVVVPVDGDRKVESAVLRADATAGRAWIEVTLAKRFLSGKEARQRGSAIQVAIPDLAFDRSTGEISVLSGGRRVTCGVLEGHVRVTGACAIAATIETVDADTGLGTARRDQLVVEVRPR